MEGTITISKNFDADGKLESETRIIRKNLKSEEEDDGKRTEYGEKLKDVISILQGLSVDRAKCILYDAKELVEESTVEPSVLKSKKFNSIIENSKP